MQFQDLDRKQVTTNLNETLNVFESTAQKLVTLDPDEASLSCKNKTFKAPMLISESERCFITLINLRCSKSWTDTSVTVYVLSRNV